MNPIVLGVLTILCVSAGVTLLRWAFLAFRRSGTEEQAPAPLPLDVPYRCECCDEPATRYRPVIERSALDRDPFGHKRLHGQAPMYVVGVQADRPRLCAAHERLIRQWNEEALAEGRALTARHNAMLEQRYARLVNELVARAQVQAQRDEETIDAIRSEDVPKLPPAQPQHGTVTLLPGKRDDEGDR